jgi:hypothetical protein
VKFNRQSPASDLQFVHPSGEITMSKYLENVERYVDSPNVDAVEALVGHLGIALQNRDSAGVAVTDPGELEAVKKGFCSKTLFSWIATRLGGSIARATPLRVPVGYDGNYPFRTDRTPVMLVVSRLPFSPG